MCKLKSLANDSRIIYIQKAKGEQVARFLRARLFRALEVRARCIFAPWLFEAEEKSRVSGEPWREEADSVLDDDDLSRDSLVCSFRKFRWSAKRFSRVLFLFRC